MRKCFKASFHLVNIHEKSGYNVTKPSIFIDPSVEALGYNLCFVAFKINMIDCFFGDGFQLVFIRFFRPVRF